MTHDSTPPGWYDDGQGGQRWWDGHQWGAPAADPPTQQPPVHQPGVEHDDPARTSRAPLWAGLAVLVVAVIAFAVAAFVAPGFLLSDDDGRASDDPDTSETTTGDASATDPTASSDPADPTSSDAPTETESSTADVDPMIDDPAVVVQDFYDAAFAGDCATATALVSRRFLDEEGGCDPEDFDPEDSAGLEFTIGESTVEESTATVLITLTQDGSDAQASVLLVLEDDGWKVDGFGDADGEPFEQPTASSVPSPSGPDD